MYVRHQQQLGATVEDEATESIVLLRRIAAAQDRFVDNELRLRYIQIAAVLAIPLAGAVWRAILGRRNVPAL